MKGLTGQCVHRHGEGLLGVREEAPKWSSGAGASADRAGLTNARNTHYFAFIGVMNGLLML